jgi:hypothetical protein
MDPEHLARRLDSKFLIQLAAASGYDDVSLRMLETFRAQGLLPRLTRDGHRGRAPVWIYPAGADQQLLSLLRWREHTKDPKTLRVLLWLDGFPIPSATVRDAVADGLKAVLNLLEREIAVQAKRRGMDPQNRTDREQTLGLMAAELAAKRGPKALPRHSRVTASQRSRAVELMLRIFTFGERVETTADDATAVERALGVAPNGRRHRVFDAGPWLTGPADAFFAAADVIALPNALRTILEATDSELETARHIVAMLWRHLPLMARILVVLFDDENYAGMSGLGRLDQQPDLVMMMIPAVIGMLRAGWEDHLQVIMDSLAAVPDLAAQAQQLLEMPSKTIDANLAGQPIEVRQRARRMIDAAIEGKFDLPLHAERNG